MLSPPEQPPLPGARSASSSSATTRPAAGVEGQRETVAELEAGGESAVAAVGAAVRLLRCGHPHRAVGVVETDQVRHQLAPDGRAGPSGSSQQVGQVQVPAYGAQTCADVGLPSQLERDRVAAVLPARVAADVRQHRVGVGNQPTVGLGAGQLGNPRTPRAGSATALETADDTRPSRPPSVVRRPCLGRFCSRGSTPLRLPYV